jgi:hypothetical protein
VEQLLELANQRLLTQIPKLTLALPPGVNQVVVEIDGKVVSPAIIGKPTPMDPGAHRIAARAAGHQPFEKKVVIGSGESLNLELRLVPLDVQPAVAKATASPKRDEVERSPSASGFGAREATLIGEAVLVAAGVGVGIGFTLAQANATDRAKSAQASIDARSSGDVGACQSAAPLSECAQLREALDARQSHGRFAAVGFIGAGVSAAALVATWILWPASENAVAVQLRPRGVGWDLRAGVHF